MSTPRAQDYTVRLPGYPSPDTQSIRITTAVRICRMYQGRPPTPAALMADFGMSRPTAYRWARALRDDQEQACKS